MTYETLFIELNPWINLYAYVLTYLQWNFTENIWVQFSAYVQPISAHVIEMDFWQPVV
jgi:hypothetical protein